MAKYNDNVARHNPGGMRLPGQSTGFASYATDEAGVAAIARQLSIYGSRGNDTISGIVNKYAPSNENDVAAYVRDMSSTTGFQPGEHLKLSDNGVMSKLVSAITKHEHIKYFPPQAVVQIINQTGGSAVVASRQIAVAPVPFITSTGGVAP